MIQSCLKLLKKYSFPILLLQCLFASCNNTAIKNAIIDKSIPLDSSFQFPAYPVMDGRMKEVSGIASGRLNPNTIWTHNDSGDKSAFYLLSERGLFLRQFPFSGITLRDCEDMAVGPGPDKHLNYIYLGDIGNNLKLHNTFHIYQFPEPYADKSKDNQWYKHINDISFKYEDKTQDSETLMVDPVNKDLIIISKENTKSTVYSLSYPYSLHKVNIAKKIAVLPYTRICAGDISSDGSEIIIKNYYNIFYWKRKKGETIAQTFKRKPHRLPYVFETQGESLCWKADGSGYFTISAASNIVKTSIYFYPRIK